MSYSPYNMERTRAPRRRTPWWIYAGAILLAGLVIWAAVKAFPSRDVQDETAAVEPASEASAEIETPPSLPTETTRTEQPIRAAPVPTAPPVVASTPAPAPVMSGPVGSSLQKALDAKARDDYAAARAAALSVWNTSSDAQEKLHAEAILNEVGMALVFSGREMPEKVDYTVQPGDSLEKIAKKFSTTIELIKAGNNISGHIIRAGDRLRIVDGKFSVKVSKSRNDLELYLNDQFFKRYRVGTGEYNKTPVGDFVVNDRIAQPTWWRPDGKAIPFGDPENLLGTHWLSINVKGYGLHGTWEPDTIGKQLSAGCVRMLNEDIEQLFALLPLGSPVSIRD